MNIHGGATVTRFQSNEAQSLTAELVQSGEPTKQESRAMCTCHLSENIVSRVPRRQDVDIGRSTERYLTM